MNKERRACILGVEERTVEDQLTIQMLRVCMCVCVSQATVAPHGYPFHLLYSSMLSPPKSELGITIYIHAVHQ